MESDPPPSYSSVVDNDQLRRRLPVQKEQQKQEIERDKAMDELSKGPEEIKSRSIDADGPSEPDLNEQQERQRIEQIGLWTRFKRGLESVAMFFIQILD